MKFSSPLPLVGEEISAHKTFMDTIGRTTLKLSAMNLVDQSRDTDVIVTYDYSLSAALRKPLTIFGGVLAIFVTAWLVGNIDVSIATKK